MSAVSTEFGLDRVAADFSGEFAVHCVEQQPGGAAAAFAPRRADRPVVVRNFLEPEAVAADQRDTDSLRLKLRRDLRNQQVGGDEQRVRPGPGQKVPDRRAAVSGFRPAPFDQCAVHLHVALHRMQIRMELLEHAGIDPRLDMPDETDPAAFALFSEIVDRIADAAREVEEDAGHIGVRDLVPGADHRPPGRRDPVQQPLFSRADHNPARRLRQPDPAQVEQMGLRLGNDVIQNHPAACCGKNIVKFEVPESVVEQYRAAPGWREFKRIAAHRELTCRPTMVKALNGKSERKLILDAEGEWEVESKPEWCTLSAMSGNKKTELTLTLESGTNYREGEIIFRLKDYDYTTSCRVYQYDFEYADDEVLVLQNHKVGQGINLIFLGDGYDAEDISRGDYLQVMNEQMERFFAIEPYRTYRDYFDVYTAIAVSPENGIGGVNTIRDTKFGTTFTNDVGLLGEYDEIFAYVMKIPSVNESNLSQSLIVITPNTTDYGGITQMWEDGSAIAFCPLSGDNYPYDARGIVQHEAGGHGFGKLGDEYIYYNSFIDDCLCLGAFKWGKALGWYENLSLTGKMHEVPWAHFIFDDRYSDVVDIYEGGFTHTRGVFRSEQNSCMNNNIQYHSAISREAIVKRIMLYAGETYSFDEFVKNDKRGSDNLSRSTRDMDFGTKARGNQYPPVIHKGRPSILK
mgnify:CR=1 FL=1